MDEEVERPVGQTWTNPFTGEKYRWNGRDWEKVNGG